MTCLTDFTSNSLSPKWSADGRHIYFLSDRGGSMQVRRTNASGGDATQITGSGDGEGGVQADADGSTYLVVDVDTTAKTVTFVL